MNENALLERVKALIQRCDDSKQDPLSVGNEILQGTLTLIGAIYGSNSPHLTTLQSAHRTAFADGPGDQGYKTRRALPVLRGALENIRTELEVGLLGDVRREITGGIITDFLQLARHTLDDRSEGAKNVAAVLAAASFEDTIRRMGRDFAGVMGKDDLDDVIGALKSAGILKSPQLGIVLSYLSFRNHALHANRDQIDRTSVTSVLAFVEELLMKHYT